MPVTKSAAKALRRDRRRTIVNLKIKKAYKEAVRAVRRNPSVEVLQKAYSLLDRAAKKRVIHKNKAARLKSRLSKLLAKTPKLPKSPKTPKPPQKTNRKKAAKPAITKKDKPRK